MSEKIFEAKITKNVKVAELTYCMGLSCPSGVLSIPGQFVSIYCNDLTFRRPFGIFSNENGNIEILYKVRGQGTKYLVSLNEGDSVNAAGPFGNGFKISHKKSLLVGAGMGVAPITFLKTELDENHVSNFYISGFLTENQIPLTHLTDEIYTDDGSRGIKGNILSCIDEVISEIKPEVIYACGPVPVLRKISEKGKKYGIETQVSLEKVMACSIGVCRGCVIDIKKEGKFVNASVCKDGPVFNAEEIVWEKMC